MNPFPLAVAWILSVAVATSFVYIGYQLDNHNARISNLEAARD